MELAKRCLDVGLYTGDLDAHRRFWEVDLGLPYEGFQKLGGGVRQHRFGVHGSVLKVNHARDPLPDQPGGLRRITVATDRAPAPTDLMDPDGTLVRLVPVGLGGVTALGIELATDDVEAARRWWVDGIGAEQIADEAVRVGTTVVHLVAEPGRAPTGPMKARGLRYLTAQVTDVVAEHDRLVGLGVEAPMAPTRLGDTAAIAFVRTPDGDWLELSQRADLTGPLPDI